MNIPKFHSGMTTGEIADPAMKITDQKEADLYFDALVQFYMKEFGGSKEERESITRQNLGYFAGYYDSETRERVERLFKCAHPVFGSIAKNGPPTAEEAFEMGKKMGESMK